MITKNNLLYWWITLNIWVLTPFVWIEKQYEKYKRFRLLLYIRWQIMMDNLKNNKNLDKGISIKGFDYILYEDDIDIYKDEFKKLKREDIFKIKAMLEFHKRPGTILGKYFHVSNTTIYRAFERKI